MLIHQQNSSQIFVIFIDQFTLFILFICKSVHVSVKHTLLLQIILYSDNPRLEFHLAVRRIDFRN